MIFKKRGRKAKRKSNINIFYHDKVSIDLEKVQTETEVLNEKFTMYKQLKSNLSWPRGESRPLPLRQMAIHCVFDLPMSGTFKVETMTLSAATTICASLFSMRRTTLKREVDHYMSTGMILKDKPGKTKNTI